MGDTGLTGRKIIVDTYGGSCPHGGGAFSGKDPTKVDRSACYMARHVAKNIVGAGLAERAQVQVAYAIGVAEPVSIMVNVRHRQGLRREDGTARPPALDFTPAGIIKYLNLRRPFYRRPPRTIPGRNEPEFTWERLDRQRSPRRRGALIADRLLTINSASRPLNGPLAAGEIPERCGTCIQEIGPRRRPLGSGSFSCSWPWALLGQAVPCTPTGSGSRKSASRAFTTRLA
jgi:hypothetical protein